MLMSTRLSWSIRWKDKDGFSGGSFSMKSYQAKYVLAACIAVVLILAASITYLCAHSQAWLNAVNPFVDFMDGFASTRRMGSGSNYPELSAVYYSIAIFVTPLAMAWYIAYSYFPPMWWVSGIYSGWKKVRRSIVVCFFIAFNIGFFISAEGQDSRLFHVGTSFEKMLLYGWLGFWACGVSLGVIIIDAWKIVTNR